MCSKNSKVISIYNDSCRYLDHNSVKKLKGVSAKLLLWLAVHDVKIDLSSPEKIQMKGLGGSIQRTFPVKAFAIGE